MSSQNTNFKWLNYKPVFCFSWSNLLNVFIAPLQRWHPLLLSIHVCICTDKHTHMQICSKMEFLLLEGRNSPMIIITLFLHRKMVIAVKSFLLFHSFILIHILLSMCKTIFQSPNPAWFCHYFGMTFWFYTKLRGIWGNFGGGVLLLTSCLPVQPHFLFNLPQLHHMHYSQVKLLTAPEGTWC